MKFDKPYSLKEIAALIDVEFSGDPDHIVLGMNEIHVVESGDIVFVDHPKYYDKALESAATTILINKNVDCPDGKGLLLSDDPFRDFNKLTKLFRPFETSEKAISTRAKIGENTVLQPNVFVGNYVTIGKNCVIHANVCIYDHCEIGDNVIIHAGAVIGADAFYYKKRADGFDQLLSGGRVVLEDNVTIGALCTIDRGVTGDTTIGEGSKLDNQVHIGHDTVVGKRCLIAAQTGIAGCVIIEDEVTIWGQVGMASGITVGAKAIIFAQSGLNKSLEGGKTYWGSPAEDSREAMKNIINVRKISSILDKLK